MAVRAEAEEVIGRKGERGCFIIPTVQAILVAEVSSISILDRIATGLRDKIRVADD